MKLPILIEIQEAIDQIVFEKEDMIKPLIFKPHQFKTNISENLINPISIIQRSEFQRDINTSNILVLDPLPINPNFIKNVRKVLNHIKEISGISKGERKWIAVKKCADHHKAWDSVCNIYRHVTAIELVWPYVISDFNLTVNGYLGQIKNQKDELYKLKYEQVY